MAILTPDRPLKITPNPGPQGYHENLLREAGLVLHRGCIVTPGFGPVSAPLGLYPRAQVAELPEVVQAAKPFQPYILGLLHLPLSEDYRGTLKLADPDVSEAEAWAVFLESLMDWLDLDGTVETKPDRDLGPIVRMVLGGNTLNLARRTEDYLRLLDNLTSLALPRKPWTDGLGLEALMTWFSGLAGSGKLYHDGRFIQYPDKHGFHGTDEPLGELINPVKHPKR